MHDKILALQSEIQVLKDEIARRPKSVIVACERKLDAFQADKFKARIVAPEVYEIQIEVDNGDIYIFKNAVSLSTPSADFEYILAEGIAGNVKIIPMERTR